MTAAKTTARPLTGNDRFDVIVIGGGPAGITAAVHAGMLGAKVALLDRRRLGGTCTNTGCVPTRVLAITARLLRDIRGAAAYGIRVSEPTLDWGETVARVRQTIGNIGQLKRTPDKLRSLGGEVILEGSAAFQDAHTVKLADTGRVLSAGHFILAVGGRARRLPFPGAELALTPDELTELATLPRSVVIIGSGYTGVQVTTVLNAFGVAVTLLETLPRILPPADADVARTLRESFERQGIQIVTGIGGVERLERGPDGTLRLTYTLGGQTRLLQTDAVMIAAGWPAATEGLGLEAAGVKVERGFIEVNEQLQTSVPHIYAAGDANGRDMLVQGAVFEAELAAENAVRGTAQPYTRMSLPSGGFTDPDHAGVGMTEQQARESGMNYAVAVAHYADLERAIIDGRTTGFLKLVAEVPTGRIVGAHGTGENAVEVMQAVATAMSSGATAATLSAVRFAYPTYTAIVGEAARKLELLLRQKESAGRTE
ncbi:dihydrolipoyl dehydrogenase family protein [Deinococcus altitudinis]|uniref:dihydrolipoyl dehydrogenase family protein n=1 Tax=Deinococcus altitudinis TaxID=468914 RepID=UPI00389203B9